MTEDADLPAAAYDALLRAHPWIRSRDPHAHLPRGWLALATEMLEAMDAAMAFALVDHPRARVERWSTKAKLGGLRVWFRLEGAGGDLMAALRAPADRAERESTRTCEACGSPGRTRDVGGWLSTLCEAHVPPRRRADLR